MGEWLLGGLLLGLASIGVHTWRTGISPVFTTPRVRRTLLEMLPHDPGGEVCELGCGWGGLALSLSRRYPQTRVAAYELSPLPWLVSALRRRLRRVHNLRIYRRDFYREDLSGAAVVVCYLYPGAMQRLGEKFERELGDGALVISNYFPIPAWTPTRVRRAQDLEASPVYLYRVPDSLAVTRNA